MSKGQHIGYLRVSTSEQNTARQLVDLLHSLDEVFSDRVSGKSTDRPQLQAMLKHIRKGDTLHVHSLDRLARNTEDLLRLVRQIKAKGVTLHFAKEKITLDAVAADPMKAAMDDLTITIFGAIAQMERATLLERQREGIEQAKKAGKYRGRAPKPNAAQIADLRARCADGEEKAAVARSMGISRATLYRHIDSAG
ncbi:transposase [Paraburkholderia steynii]|uniref:Transposase n=1 Tax=Paraburkholderia steynii TaxID=1245441 RepID=A0A4R0XEG7_9BURK|nr:transposase [Paraburkholderia steynii]